jgi:hypothetical protein
VKAEATEGEGEGEVGLVAKGLQRTSGLAEREPGVWRKHRTEVTEVTEGELGLGKLPNSVTPELLQLLTPVKSIARRSQRSRRGRGIWDWW